MIALIDYGAGNTASVSNILNELNADFILTSDKKNIEAADKIILPGVGEASSAMERLSELGLIETLKNLTQPFLGICLGMQLLCESTEEGDVSCIGIFQEKVKRFQASGFKVPHMGWNTIKMATSDRLLEGIPNEIYFYFAHSYFVPQNEFTTSICNYGIDFSASLRHKNFYGVQFHPEKSAQQGIKILKNFLEI
ncbi:MAG: imidazole glycerol phosphate synthase, glutamine amidotransferase subunit [Ignavibacteria bacterium RIFOXYB2_FULL_35_12]|nr:MAG: imidazole glycerol phosphate synthase, glutamine amidotransferase subunit [Ignavibacteria bacterium GWA2_36_19]OGU53003.1 MAG: imidazole glycerol phosphate synthase, glutamine amidotransferase subunit [Ignavibacteria bacterium GWC2_35_8]OGU56020.1 MAG: imidazole glycerol phosphate synthase, glutamine amidotransferase subunit [Ignavibacteria bacterium GWF2_35_20]OGU82789.1 MAG: imidazole glycerol phosphate synthase, glutamine amidotransferase subunit [Ignavibacteria bacterium RIFOXYA2_FUL